MRSRVCAGVRAPVRALSCGHLGLRSCVCARLCVLVVVCVLGYARARVCESACVQLCMCAVVCVR